MSGQLWQNLCQCFYPHQIKKCQRKVKFNHKKRALKMESIIVGGCDDYNGLGEKPNNENIGGYSTISPPVKLSFDPSSHLSYSAYNEHSVLVTNNGSLKGVGNNDGGRISDTLEKNMHR